VRSLVWRFHPSPIYSYELSATSITAVPSSTPLLDALKAAKEASTIKGYHSHYREQSNQPRIRAQELEDEETFNRNAPLLSKSQQDPILHGPPDSLTKDIEKGKEKDDRDKEVGGGGKKGKNKAKAALGPKSPKPTPAAPQPATTSVPSTRPATDSSRPRPATGINARVLAALGATGDARGGAPRKAGRQREVSGGAPNTDNPAQSALTPAPASASGSSSAPAPVLAPPLPAGVIAIPSPLKTSDASSGPPKSRRGKNRSRGGGEGGKETGGTNPAPASTAPPNSADMPRIDDPGQALPPVVPTQRGRGGSSGRGRGGRGRGRGRGGARGTANQPSAPAG
jgi:hypothetical protein